MSTTEPVKQDEASKAGDSIAEGIKMKASELQEGLKIKDADARYELQYSKSI